MLLQLLHFKILLVNIICSTTRIALSLLFNEVKIAKLGSSGLGNFIDILFYFKSQPITQFSELTKAETLKLQIIIVSNTLAVTALQNIIRKYYM